MIATAAIVWAVLASLLSIGVFVAVTIELKAGTKAIEESGRLRDIAVARLVDAEDRLRQIEQQRHNAAVKARQAQLAKRRAAVLAKAHEVAPQVERRAA